jgi:hypothetical protein
MRHVGALFMIRNLIILTILFLSLNCPAHAADVGVIALLKDMDNLTVENFIDTISISKNMNANATLGAPNWREMEPRKGVYDFDHPLGGVVYSTQQGMEKLYLNLQVINTVKRKVPADLMDVAWDDPVMIQRFEGLIAAIKDMKTINPLAVSVGNEVDVYFGEHPDETQSYLNFIKVVRPIIHKYFPDIPVGVTVTFDGIHNGREDVVRRIVDASDIMYVTYYPIINFIPLPVADIPQHLERIKTIAGNKPIVFQEVGLPSSEQVTLSEIKQAAFFEAALPALMNDPQVVALFVFAMHDISPKLCDQLTGYYGANAWPQDAQGGFRAFLCSLGLRDYQGRAKPSFSVVEKIFTQK